MFMGVIVIVSIITFLAYIWINIIITLMALRYFSYEIEFPFRVSWQSLLGSNSSLRVQQKINHLEIMGRIVERVEFQVISKKI